MYICFCIYVCVLFQCYNFTFIVFISVYYFFEMLYDKPYVVCTAILESYCLYDLRCFVKRRFAFKVGEIRYKCIRVDKCTNVIFVS